MLRTVCHIETPRNDALRLRFLRRGWAVEDISAVVDCRFSCWRNTLSRGYEFSLRFWETWTLFTRDIKDTYLQIIATCNVFGKEEQKITIEWMTDISILTLTMMEKNTFRRRHKSSINYVNFGSVREITPILGVLITHEMEGLHLSPLSATAETWKLTSDTARYDRNSFRRTRSVPKLHAPHTNIPDSISLRSNKCPMTHVLKHQARRVAYLERVRVLK